MSGCLCSPTTKRLVLLGLGVFIIIADQLTKWYVLETVFQDTRTPFLTWLFEMGEKIPYDHLELLPFLNLVIVWNEGISFGLFNDGDGGDQWPLILLSSLIIILFTIWFFKTKACLPMIGLALAISGALGNIIDRVRFGAVADFIDVHGFGYHWPAFNIADSAIVIGVVMILIDGVFLTKEKPEQN